VSLSDEDVEFLTNHQTAAMITVSSKGIPKVARVGVALVDGRLWSSGTEERVRTKRLRRDPRCTLFVFDAGYSWLALESTVTILEGPDGPPKNLELFRVMQNKPTGPLQWFGGELEEDDFLAKMVEEGRLVYEFDVQRSYGLH
jgi:uncharacterized pyridoxamine 5'-phosphate oxidase family protein